MTYTHKRAPPAPRSPPTVPPPPRSAHWARQDPQSDLRTASRAWRVLMRCVYTRGSHIYVPHIYGAFNYSGAPSDAARANDITLIMLSGPTLGVLAKPR